MQIKAYSCTHALLIFLVFLKRHKPLTYTHSVTRPFLNPNLSLALAIMVIILHTQPFDKCTRSYTLFHTSHNCINQQLYTHTHLTRARACVYALCFSWEAWHTHPWIHPESSIRPISGHARDSKPSRPALNVMPCYHSNRWVSSKMLFTSQLHRYLILEELIWRKTYSSAFTT